MTYPCRSNTCDHLQCFDANLFLMMNERKPKWLCPVCNKLALFENLMVDGYFKEVMIFTTYRTINYLTTYIGTSTYTYNLHLAILTDSGDCRSTVAQRRT
jgi:hypothetical protein